MLDIPEITEQQAEVNKEDILSNLKNKLLYLKLEVAKFNYLILLSDIIEIKKTNLVTPILMQSANERKLYGTFYYQNQIIPVYKLGISRNNNEISIFIKDCRQDKKELDIQKYNDLLLVEYNGYYGFIIDDINSSEIIDINFAKSINAIENYDIIDVKQLINNIKI